MIRWMTNVVWLNKYNAICQVNCDLMLLVAFNSCYMQPAVIIFNVVDISHCRRLHPLNMVSHPTPR